MLAPTRSRPLLAASTVLGVLLFSACSAHDETSQDTATADSMNSTERSEISAGGTLKWPVEDITENLNSHHVDGGSVDTARIVSSMMPVIMKVDPAGKVSPNSDYLSDVKVAQDSGRQTVTYKINQKAKWTDGRAVSYRDFQALWRASNGKNPSYGVASKAGYELISSVSRGVDDREVIVSFARPFGEWQSLFNPLYPSSVIGTEQGFNKGYVEKIPVTAGPFNFSALDATARTLTVTRNPDWWGERAMLDRIIFRALEESVAESAFANGEIDFVNVGANASAYSHVKQVKNSQVRRAGAPNFRHFTFNGQGEILQDVRVRRALARAINREVVAKSALQGLDQTATTLGNHFLFPGQQGYQDNAGDIGEFDPEGAKRELDAAGWKMDGNGRKKGGVPLELRFVIPSDLQEAANEGKLLKDMLASVGISLRIQSVPGAQLFDKYIIPGDYDITAFNWFGSAFPVTANQPIYAAPKDGSNQLNFARVGSPKIDAALNRASASLDSETTLREINTADSLVWQEAAVIPLYQSPQIVVSKESLANFGANGFASVNYQDIGFTKP
ncbi:ABC transporter family substrate-binding protein [Streptomyces sp. NPDC014861]|uniref:ABC transporter family substrate-binding protein n=1 Tax=Streptomyces sp. NPDC014861 TaxID=3364923 RepID=UPI0036FE3585